MQNNYIESMLVIAATLFTTVVSCTTKNPVETPKFEGNVFSVSNQSADTIMIEYSYNYLYELVTDTSAPVKPEVTCDFFYSDCMNGGPASLQSVMTSVYIMVVVGGEIIYSQPVDLTGWEKKKYADGNRVGTRYLYIYR